MVVNVYYNWLVIIPVGLWVFHLFRGVHGRQYPWVTLCITVVSTVMLILLTMLLRDLHGLPRELWTTNPTLKSINSLFVMLYTFILALLPLEGLIAIARIIRHRLQNTKTKYIDYILTINSPTKGIMRVKVEQKDSHTVRVTFLDGISAGYGFGMTRNMAFSRGAWIPAIFSIFSIFRFKMRRYRRTLPPPYSQEEIYNAAKDFIEQLGPSGYLDDGP